MRILLISMMLMFGFGASLVAQDKKPVKTDKEKVIFEVSMTCEKCQARIEKNIAFEKGVTDLKVDLENKTVEIEYKKDKTTVEKLQKALEKLGYEAKEVKKDKKEEKKK